MRIGASHYPFRVKEVIPLILPLVGVIIGGMLTVGGQYWHTRRQEVLNYHKALRLVLMDIQRTKGRSHALKSVKTWYDHLPLGIPSFDKYGAALSRNLPATAWENLLKVQSLSEYAEFARLHLNRDKDRHIRLSPNVADGIFGDIEEAATDATRELTRLLPRRIRGKNGPPAVDG